MRRDLRAVSGGTGRYERPAHLTTQPNQEVAMASSNRSTSHPAPSVEAFARAHQPSHKGRFYPITNKQLGEIFLKGYDLALKINGKTKIIDRVERDPKTGRVIAVTFKK